MKKFFAFNVILVLILTMSYYEIPCKAQDNLDVSSRSAILVEASTGTVLYEKNADEMLKPASVTKIMTLILIFEGLSKGDFSYEDIVVISEHAAGMGGSQCFFEAGEQQCVKDMIKCIEVASGNDAAVAMAEFVAGSEAAFVDRMNEKAAELGMNNTHFENACGLDSENHLTTARDISIMSRYLTTKYPEIFEFSGIWMDHIVHKTARGESVFDLVNTNKFLNLYTGATGLKTGYTSSARYCISATASRNDIDLIAVVMGAETKEDRNSDIKTLFDYGFRFCTVYRDSNVIDDGISIKIKGGYKKTIDYYTIDELSFVLCGEKPDQVVKEIIINKDLRAPIFEGDSIGLIQYSVDGKLVFQENIYASEDVDRIKYKSTLINVLRNIFLLD